MTPYDRKLKMLLPLAQACSECTMCELGLKPAVRGDEERNPHVLSNLKPHRFMIVGQNPGWTELQRKEPFVGEAGRTFDDEIAKHCLSRDEFYICNAVRCFTPGNTPPIWHHMERCEPFLRMEMHLIKPKLVIALGGVAFQQLCPGVPFSANLKKIVKSEKFGVPVFPIYHPSPLNLKDESRLAAFQDQIRVMCALVKRLRQKEETPPVELTAAGPPPGAKRLGS